MKTQSARTLLIASVVTLVLAWISLAPALAFLLSLVAVLLAAGSLLLAPRTLRLWTAVCLVLAIFSVIAHFDGFRSDQQRYRQRAKGLPATAPQPTSPVSPREAP